MKTWFDNKIFLILGAVVDVIWISLLWYLCCIPVITAGAATSAMYYTVHMRIFKGDGYILPTYKKALLQNLKKGTALWLMFLCIDLFLAADLVFSDMALRQESGLAVFFFPVLVLMFLVLIWQISAFAYMARFEDSVKNILVKGGLIAASNMGWMVFLAVILLMSIYLLRYLIFLLVILPGAYTCLTHHVFEHIYRGKGWV